MHAITKFRKRRRAELIELLGGVCAHKDCWENKELQFDHIDPTKKSFEVSGNNLNWAWDTLLVEVYKCQLLCKKHHKEKTRAEAFAKVKHGTFWMYAKYKCRCGACKIAHSEIRKNFPSRQRKIPG